MSANGTVLDDGEDVTSPRTSAAVRPIIALAYYHRYTIDPENAEELPNSITWLASVERVEKAIRHLSVHRSHNLDVSNGHDALVNVSNAKQMTFTGTREALRESLAPFEARGATGVIFGTTGYNVERELRPTRRLRDCRDRSAIGAVTGALALRAVTGEIVSFANAAAFDSRWTCPTASQAG